MPPSAVPLLRRGPVAGGAAGQTGPGARGLERAHFRRAALALSALDSERRIGIFRFLAARSPALVIPATIARALGISERTIEAELERLLQAGLIHAHGHGRHQAFNADNARARECLDLIHALARALGTV